jgi:hypothetical protein
MDLPALLGPQMVSTSSFFVLRDKLSMIL